MDSADTYADLADVIMTIGREITSRMYADPDIVRLSATEVNVMRYIDRHPGVAPSVVADATGLQRSNLSKALRDLEAKGLVQRLVDDADNRQATLHPTARAAQNLARLRHSWATLLSDGLGGRASATQLAGALGVLQELEAGLAESRARR